MSGQLRATFAALLLAAVALALGLSASPQLHQRLHQDSNWTSHECAATLLSSGSVEHSAVGLLALEPERVPRGPALAVVRCPRRAARLAFSLLEHAPPALP